MKDFIRTELRKNLLFEGEVNLNFKNSKTNKNGDIITLYANDQMVGDIELDYNGDVMVISQLDILNKFRGLGFAKQLMNQAIKRASRNNISKIILEPEPMDLEGIDKSGLYDFYGKFGFVDSGNGKMELLISDSITESKDKKITCKNCNWSWKESESKKEDLYLCHKCGYDNTPR